MADLRNSYLRLELRNPVITSTGPLSQSVENIRALADTGLGAMAMFSLSEKQLLRDAEHLVELEEQFADITPEAISFFPEVPHAEADAVADRLRFVEEGIQAIDMSLIAPLNGTSRGGQVHSARSLQDTGTAALELNIYHVPDNLTLGGEEVEQRYLDILRAVKLEVSIPVAVRLSPYFSSVGTMCQRLDRAGADGLVLFNRFLQPSINLDRLEVVSRVTLSSPVGARLPHTWIAVLRDRVEASLVASPEVDQPGDVVKRLLAGADVVYTIPALVRYGVRHATHLIEGLKSWFDGRRLTLDQACGMLAVSGRTPTNAYERAGYTATLEKAKTTYGSLS